MTLGNSAKMIPAMSEVIVLSPHLDDAVFNCWRTINEADDDVTVLGIFAGLPEAGTSRLWDRLCGQSNSRQMVLKRRQEDKLALLNTKASIIHLDFLDNQYRSELPKIEKIVSEIVNHSSKSATFLAPLSCSHLWRHPDHTLVAQAALALKKSGRAVSFYPDSPYMYLRKTASKAYLEKLSNFYSKRLGFLVSAKLIALSEQEKSAKQQAMLAYKSQYLATNLVSLGGLNRIAKRDYEIIVTPELPRSS